MKKNLDCFEHLHAIMVSITTRDTTYEYMDRDASTIVIANGLLNVIIHLVLFFLYSNYKLLVSN